MTVVIRSAARNRWIRDVKSASAEAMKNSSMPPLPDSASMASSTRLMSVLLLPRCVSDGQSITRNPARVQYGPVLRVHHRVQVAVADQEAPGFLAGAAVGQRLRPVLGILGEPLGGGRVQGHQTGVDVVEINEHRGADAGPPGLGERFAHRPSVPAGGGPGQIWSFVLHFTPRLREAPRAPPATAIDTCWPTLSAFSTRESIPWPPPLPALGGGHARVLAATPTLASATHSGRPGP